MADLAVADSLPAGRHDPLLIRIVVREEIVCGCQIGISRKTLVFLITLYKIKASD